MNINEKTESFYAESVDTNGSIRITIPKSLADAAGFKAGDKFKIWLRKLEQEE